MPKTDFLTAAEAAELLHVKLDTLYVYVSRKRIRSIASPEGSKRLYWRADVERARRGTTGRVSPGESAITLYTSEDLFYRGRSVHDLTETASFEQVAALLWDVDASVAFTKHLPKLPASARAVSRVLNSETAVTKCLSMFSLLEAANPHSFDLSTLGMARTGADVIRWLCALTLNRSAPVAAPIHEVFAAALGLTVEQADLARRVLILSADHGLESATFAVRAMASTGVSPWHCVATGLSVMSGRRSRIGHFGRVERLIAEILESEMPITPVIHRVQESERVPGFQDAVSYAEDARVRILHGTLRAVMADDPEFRKIELAADTVREIQGLEPTFAYFSTFAWRKIGLHRHEAPFMLGRSAGWVAHAMEQYQSGERGRAELHYRGPLPKL